MAQPRFDSVAQYLDAQTPAVRADVERLRSVIASAEPRLVEVIKWNSPSFTLDGADRLTISVSRSGAVVVVLHRGTAQVETKGKASTFAGDPNAVLTWHSDIRASMPAEVDSDVAREIIRSWLAT